METTLSKKQEEKLFKVLGGEDESIRKAIEFIEEKHAGQYRKSGEPYVVHPIEVAITLAELGMDKSTIIAGLMHDVLEDTETTYEEIKQKFGKELQAYYLYKVQLYACEKELQDLSKAINLPFEIKKTSLVYANVIAYDPSGNDTFILINKGQDAGLWEGMVVFYEDKLVGIVDEVYGGSSRVRTVFSKDFSISATSKDKAYIYKGGYPYGSLLHVNLEDPLKVGDTVFLRSPSKNLPPFIIGTVVSISEEGKSFFKKVEVKPAVDVRRISICTLIKEKL